MSGKGTRQEKRVVSSLVAAEQTVGACGRQPGPGGTEPLKGKPLPPPRSYHCQRDEQVQMSHTQLRTHSPLHRMVAHTGLYWPPPE